MIHPKAISLMDTDRGNGIVTAKELIMFHNRSILQRQIGTPASELFFNVTINGSGRDLVFQMFVSETSTGICLIEDEQHIMEAEVDILKALHLVKKAWASLQPHIMINLFMKAGFQSTLIQPYMVPPEDKCDLIE
ncbi:unnamed protein product [Echinostoma caproni]|uniref:EF-hand domain-containing protein n=1 Tax=Echinostoma caproni TaxID=27848 RepID=A0A183A9Z3_9TREM|nr:unnamed protein product [Echinostoma caproni]